MAAFFSARYLTLMDALQNFDGNSIGRKRLSDITITVSSGKVGMVSADLVEGNSKALLFLNTNDCIGQLMKLKVLQHELNGMSSILKLKTSELKENEKLIKELLSKISSEDNSSKCEEAEANATQIANDKKCNPYKKRKLKEPYLGSTILERQVASEGQIDGRSRRSLRLKSSDLNPESCGIKDSLKIENPKVPVSHQVVQEGKAEGRRRSLQTKSCNLKSESCKSVEELPKIDDNILPLSHQVKSQRKVDGRRGSSISKIFCWKATA
ncbi:shugoshin-1-like isoform X11 [Canna indica]|uniref:Shugoshin-1-like isoform X11 n=1 Tax=Canna indica TaxID=4628 RepID=A0AAQ3QQ60_9LILI|nr:shugoshin-1-like isoform X11 [Canna indica]